MESNESMKDQKKAKLDKIIIKDLLLRCIIGINEFERKDKQDVLINVVVWTDFARLVETDDIDKAVDYKKISKNVISLVENSKFFLTETLAEKIATVCLQPEGVKKVRVTVEKPGALRFAKSVGVEITRKRN